MPLRVVAPKLAEIITVQNPQLGLPLETTLDPQIARIQEALTFLDPLEAGALAAAAVVMVAAEGVEVVDNP